MLESAVGGEACKEGCSKATLRPLGQARVLFDGKSWVGFEWGLVCKHSGLKTHLSPGLNCDFFLK